MNRCIQILCTVVACVSLSTQVAAQTDQGTVMVGGSISLSLDKQESKIGNQSFQDNGDINAFSVTPSVGYFFVDGLVGGLGLNYQRLHREFENNDESTRNLLSVEPFLRYYFDNGIFGMANVGYGWGTSKNTGNNFPETATDLRLFNWQVGVGYAIFLNDHIAIEPLVSYRSEDFTSKGENSSPDVTLRESGLIIGAGFNIFLH